MTNRPTFYYENQPVRAGGILFYVKENGVKKYLLRKGKREWGDIGGKTDVGDRDIMSTIIREVVEETNGKLLDASHTNVEAWRSLPQ